MATKERKDHKEEIRFVFSAFFCGYAVFTSTVMT